MKVLEFYERALKGRRVEEQEFDLKILPGKLKELIKKYDIAYNPQEAVPQDLDMARRCFDAAVELLTEVGVYCTDTGSIIPIEKEEIKDALANAPSSHTIGEGTEAVECYHRGIGDKRRPRIIGGPAGVPLSEENCLDILTSYAKESIDGLHTGAIQTLFGQTIRANTPLELMACQYEALWAREAVRRAGKPGLSILGIMSGATSEAQDAGDFPGGLRPSDLHLVVFSNELKVNWQDLKKIAHNQNLGNIINACCTTMLGGYSGGPEGTAITAIAEALQGFVMAKPMTFTPDVIPIRHFGTSDRQATWANCMIPLAFNSAGANIILTIYIGGTAGPCTEMLCDEVAAIAIAQTASGVSTLCGVVGCEGVKMDYVTGMELRIASEIIRATAGMNLSEANEIVNELLGNYEETLKSGKAPTGKSFTECYENGLKPSKEYLDLWQKKKRELEKMGLVFH
jgi:methylamine--corrinoid protein Co-methyltransferase